MMKNWSIFAATCILEGRLSCLFVAGTFCVPSLHIHGATPVSVLNGPTAFKVQVNGSVAPFFHAILQTLSSVMTCTENKRLNGIITPNSHRFTHDTSIKSHIPNEDWKDVPDYAGIYQISNTGMVRRINIKRGKAPQKIIGQSTHRGYKIVHLSKYGKVKCFQVHRLVAMAFIPNADNKSCIDHIDCDRGNNHVSNLRWCTHKENANNPITLARYAKANSYHSKFLIEKNAKNKAYAFILSSGLLSEFTEFSRAYSGECQSTSSRIELTLKNC